MAPLSDGDRQRLREHLDTLVREDRAMLEEVAGEAARVCGRPAAFLALVDPTETRYVARLGIDVEALPRAKSICDLVLRECPKPGDVLDIKDTRLDGRVRHLDFIHHAPDVWAYAGTPVYAHYDEPIGVLAVLGRQPGELPEATRRELAKLGQALSARLASTLTPRVSRHEDIDHQVQRLMQLPAQDRLMLFEAIFEHGCEAVAIVDLEAKYLAQNSVHRHLMGYSDEQLAGKTPAIHLGEEVFGRVAQALADSGRFEGEVQSTTVDGRTLDLELSAFTVKGADGRPVCHVGIKRDLTAQRQAERALEDSIARFELAVKGSRDGLWDAKIFSLDPSANANRVYASPRCRELLGYEAVEAEQGVPSVFAQLHPEDRERVKRELRYHILRGRTFDVDMRMRTRSGGWRWFNSRGLSSGAVPDWPIRIAGSLRDITDQKALEEKLRESKDALEERIGARTQELRSANEGLLREVGDRKRAEGVHRLLYQISEAAAQATSLRDLCSLIHRSINTVLDATNFFIALHDEAAETITLPYHADAYDKVTVLPREEFERTFVFRVIREGAAIRYDERQMREMTDRGEVGVVGTPCKAWMGVPLRTGDRLIGAVVVQSYADDAKYTEEDLAMISFVSTQIANVLERHRVQEELRRKEQQLALHFRQTPLGVVMTDPAGVILDWNPAAERLFGFKSAEALGRPLAELVVNKEGRKAWDAEWRRTTESHDGHLLKFCNTGKSGDTLWCEWHNNPLVSAEDQLLGTASLVLDISTRVRAEDMLRTSEERYALAVRGANDGIWDWNLQTDEVYYSPRWREMLGLENMTVSDTPGEWLTRIHPGDLPRVEEAIANHLAGHTSHFETEYRARHRNGEYRWMLARGLAVRDGDKPPARIAGSQTDITDRINAQEQVVHAANHDSLTGLPNRALFMDRLRQCLNRLRRREKYRFALLFLDLDRFKLINDSLGHVAGDGLLRTIAERLATIVRPQDTLARFGGDEFTILLDEIGGVEDARRVADRLIEQFTAPFILNGNDVFVSASIGIVMSPDAPEEPEDILRNADMAMYQAKGQGKASHLVFDQKMREEAQHMLRLETEIRRAIDKGEFLVHYQPIVELATGRVRSFEVLLRWQHPERGLLTPSEFLKVAEESGLLCRITASSIVMAARQHRAWLDGRGKDAPVVFNYNASACELLNRDLERVLARAIGQFSIPASAIVVEVSEPVLTDGGAEVLSALRSLRGLGIQLHLDDFGTGYTSIKHFGEGLFSAIKLHPSLYARRAEGDGAQVMGTILSLVERIGLELIATGIGDAETLEAIKGLPCTLAQGVHFAPALPPDDAGALLTHPPGAGAPNG